MLISELLKDPMWVTLLGAASFILLAFLYTVWTIRRMLNSYEKKMKDLMEELRKDSELDTMDFFIMKVRLAKLMSLCAHRHPMWSKKIYNDDDKSDELPKEITEDDQPGKRPRRKL